MSHIPAMNKQQALGLNARACIFELCGIRVPLHLASLSSVRRQLLRMSRVAAGSSPATLAGTECLGASPALDRVDVHIAHIKPGEVTICVIRDPRSDDR